MLLAHIDQDKLIWSWFHVKISLEKSVPKGEFRTSLFVFSIGGSKQNVKSFWTPVSESVFYALSHGTLGFALHGSFLNHSLIGGDSSTANQIL